MTHFRIAFCTTSFLLVLLFAYAQAQMLELTHTHAYNQANPGINGNVQLMGNGYLAYLVSNEGNDELHVENIFAASEQATLTLTPSTDYILTTALASYAPDNFWLIECRGYCGEYTLLHYDNGALQTKEKFNQLEQSGLLSPVGAVATRHGEGLIAAAYGFSNPVDISVYNVIEKREVARLKGHESFVHTIAFASVNDTILASVDDNGQLILWNYANQEMIVKPDFSDEFIADIAFSALGSNLFVLQDGGVGNTDSIAVVDSYTGEIVQKINNIYAEKLLTSLAVPDISKGVLVAVAKEAITLIDDATGGVLEVFDSNDNGGKALHDQSILDAALNWPDETQLITVSADDTVKVWQRPDGSPIIR